MGLNSPTDVHVVMSLGSLAEKVRHYYRENGTQETLRMSRRYASWRLQAVRFLLRNRGKMGKVGSALKIRGDIRLRASTEGTVTIGDNVELVGDARSLNVLQSWRDAGDCR